MESAVRLRGRMCRITILFRNRNFLHCQGSCKGFLKTPAAPDCACHPLLKMQVRVAAAAAAEKISPSFAPTNETPSQRRRERVSRSVGGSVGRCVVPSLLLLLLRPCLRSRTSRRGLFRELRFVHGNGDRLPLTFHSMNRTQRGLVNCSVT